MEFSRVKKLDKQGSGTELRSGRYPRGKQHNRDGKTPMCDCLCGECGCFCVICPKCKGFGLQSSLLALSMDVSSKMGPGSPRTPLDTVVQMPSVPPLLECFMGAAIRAQCPSSCEHVAETRPRILGIGPSTSTEPKGMESENAQHSPSERWMLSWPLITPISRRANDAGNYTHGRGAGDPPCAPPGARALSINAGAVPMRCVLAAPLIPIIRNHPRAAVL